MPAVTLEQYTNSAQSSLFAGITAGATTLQVNSATNFPTGPQFRILVDAEIMLVTAVAGTTFTVTRGVEGTTGASHLTGATVTHILTQASLQTIIGQFALADTSANRPAAGVSGRLFFPTDGGPMFRDNGSSWDCWVHGLGPFTPPLSTFTTWVNQSNAVRQVNNNVPCLIYQNASTGGENLNGLVQSVGSTTFTFTGVFAVIDQPGMNNNMGLFVYDSVSSKCQGWGIRTDTNPMPCHAYKWTNPTTYSGSDAFTSTLYFNSAPLFMFRIVADGTNYYYQYSNDFVNWITVNTATIASSFITSPTHVGFYENLSNLAVNQKGGMAIYHGVVQ